MREVIVIRPRSERDGRMDQVLSYAGFQTPVKNVIFHSGEDVITGDAARIIETASELVPVKNKAVIFAISLDDVGLNPEWVFMMQKIRRDPDFFSGCVSGVIVDAPSDLYTKSMGRMVVQTANASGCLFPGRPLVEGTGSLRNFTVTALNLRGEGKDRRVPPTEDELWQAYLWSARDLIERVVGFTAPVSLRPRLLALHASVRETSNTLLLWNMVKEHLSPNIKVQELSLQNGTIHDCIGCPYTMCLHFSKKGSCYYGGVITQQVLPAFDEATAIVMLCPNYNDALSANLTALVNRLTSLYRIRQTLDKYLYGIVVSGYSGGDILVRQLISGLNMNKTLILPPHFSITETANDPESILRVEGIREKAEGFAESINCTLLQANES